MKKITTISRLFVSLLLLTLSSQLRAQDNNVTELEEFKIIIEKTDNGITLKSKKGSAWIDLSFSLNNYKPQAVDEFGMTDTHNVSKNKDSNIADFLFTVIKTDKGIELKGIEGTAWTDLSFSLAKNEKQAFDQYGMTTLN